MEETLIMMERALSSLEGYDGWVIGTCELTYKTSDGTACRTSCQPEIIKHSSSLMIVNVDAGENSLKIMLVKPASSDRTPKGGRIPGNHAGTETGTGTLQTRLAFSAEQVGYYLDQVSDYNSIHRGIGAIVPGLLMMNTLLSRIFPADAPAFHAQVRFLAPLPVGEQAFLFAAHVKDTNSGGADLHAHLLSGDGRELLKLNVTV